MEQKKFYGDDLKDGEVYDELEEDVSDFDQSTTEIIQEELKKLKAFQMSRNTNSTSNISSDAAQDKILDTHSIDNEESLSFTNFIQDTLRESCSSDSKEVFKNINTKETRRISFAEPCVTEDKSSTEEEEISISQEACSTSKQDENSEDEDKDDTIRIEFSHSSHVPDICESNNAEIQSPIDIYKMFSAPKSILKRSPNDMIYDRAPAPPLNGDSGTDTEDEDEYVKHSAYSSVSKNNNLIILLLHS